MRCGWRVLSGDGPTPNKAAIGVPGGGVWAPGLAREVRERNGVPP